MLPPPSSFFEITSARCGKKKVSGIVEQEVVRLNKRSDTGFSGLPTPRCPVEQFLLVLNLNVRQKRRWRGKEPDPGATAFHFEYSPARKEEATLIYCCLSVSWKKSRIHLGRF